MPLRYIFGQDELVTDFVCRSKIASGSAKNPSYPANRRAFGIANADNELIAGLIYFNWNQEADTIEISIEAIPGQRWLTPSTLALMYQYPFLSLGCQMMITKTMARYEHVQRMLAAMNWSLLRVPRAGGRNEDGILALLTYEDWLESKFTKRYKHDVNTVIEKAA